jgi:hypothetical protein
VNKNQPTFAGLNAEKQHTFKQFFFFLFFVPKSSFFWQNKMAKYAKKPSPVAWFVI